MSLATENGAIQRLERAYLKKEFGVRHIACENLDFSWTRKEVRQFRELWNGGISITDIAKFLKRREEEVAILIIDQSLSGRIGPRKGGILGELG